MSGHNRLSDIDERVIAEAEADLNRLLSIEPSPDLAAKVRARIDAERSSSSRWFTGWQLGLAAASLVIVGIIVTYAMRQGATEVSQPSPIVASVQPPPPPTQPSPAAVITTPARTPDVVVTNPVVPQPSQRALNGQRTADSGPRPAKEPEVLVPPDRRMAIERALAMTGSGLLDGRLFPAEPLPVVVGDDAPPVPPIVVDAVAVPLIAVVGGGIEKGSGEK